MLPTADLAGDGELLGAWRKRPADELRDIIFHACARSHVYLASLDGSSAEQMRLSRVLASLAMQRYAGTRLVDAAWTIVASAALAGDRSCQSLLTIELAGTPDLADSWLALRPRPPPVEKVDLRVRLFLRRRSRTKR